MEHSLHILLYRAFHAQRNYLRPGMQALGLGAGQPKLLVYLTGSGPCTQRQLADYFDVDPANISRMVASLEKGGFLSRRSSAGRASRRDLVQITEKGRRAGEAWRDRCREEESVMLQGFAPEERQLFADFLARAYRNLREELDQGAP